jgi:ubiquinone biosynthesis protein UbiJ
MSGMHRGLPPLLADLASELIEAIVDVTLRMDPIAAARVAALDGRSLLLRLSGTDQILAIHFTATGPRIETVPPAAPTTTVTAGAAALLAVLRGQRLTGARIDGDESLLLELESILHSLEPDPALPLERLLDRNTAGLLADVFDAGVATARTVLDAVADVGTGWLRAGGREYFVDRADYERFVARAFALRRTLDRLDARVDAAGRAGDEDPRA